MSQDHDTNQEWGQGSNPPAATIDQFTDLSAVLSGFSEDVLSPLDPDAQDVLQAYFDTARNNTGTAFDQLVAQYVQLAAGKNPAHMTPADKQQIGAQIFAQPDSPTAQTARAILKMWYLGSWYQPFPFNGKPQDLTGGVVVSGTSYSLGLAWQVMQSHAMGYSDWTYGYWQSDPPPLNDFLGG